LTKNIEIHTIMVKSAVLGYPRIGVGRAMKKVSYPPHRCPVMRPRFFQMFLELQTLMCGTQVIESYWAGKATYEELGEVSKAVRKERWESIRDAGVDIIPS
jgi:5-methyltetrahydropteroyltriglutamate--homocysteine methyltransferase